MKVHARQRPHDRAGRGVLGSHDPERTVSGRTARVFVDLSCKGLPRAGFTLGGSVSGSLR